VARVEALEAEGCSTSDAQGVADVEFAKQAAMTTTPTPTPATKDELELIAYIENQNRQLEAWVAEVPGRWASMAISDLEFLRERNLTSVAVYIRNGKETYYWDAYKSVHGIRPRWIKFSEISDAELDAMVEDLDREITAQNEAERRQTEEQNKAEVEREEELCVQHQTDIRTLVRWGVLEACPPWRNGAEWQEFANELEAEAKDEPEPEPPSL
jgi:hypothetical protein